MPLSPEVFSSRRINRIFRPNGRALIVAMDHGNFCGVMPGLSDPGQVIREVVAGGADAILTTFGVAKNYAASFGRAGLLVRLDSGKTIIAKEGREWPLRYSVEDAVRLGADGVGCMGFPGSSFEQQTLVNLAQVASDCRRWGMVLLAEMLPGGFERFDLHTPENIALAARFGVELGADLIKTKFSGSIESFSEVVAGCYRPDRGAGRNQSRVRKRSAGVCEEGDRGGRRPALRWGGMCGNTRGRESLLRPCPQSFTKTPRWMRLRRCLPKDEGRFGSGRVGPAKFGDSRPT